ncbi:MAG: glycoside hydrolase family 13 protein [Clostridiales Family XIII bacterium]|jgi:glycosidase|nr:glycoside hydrolase family 13 protein [Clostridiales Family XIII bacterium]
MNTLLLGQEKVMDANVIHDSAREKYREPLGAVASGSHIRLSVSLHEIGVREIKLKLLDHGDVRTLEMLRRAGTDDVMWDAHIKAPDDVCLLWYWFEVVLSGGGLVYYGAEPADNSGIGRLYQNPPPAFQITVHSPEFHTPDWAKSSILYQIFADRFASGDPENFKRGIEYHRNLGRDEIKVHESWDELPTYLPESGKPYYHPNDIYGGDLSGIRQRLPYLSELGVSLIYLNPIFEAASNHGYNTADYLSVDPTLGTNEDFELLSDEAKALGIRIILDGVFSHTGDDSIYFNKYGRYSDVGAYQSQSSPYYSWYKFDSFPDKYVSWWGFETLPEVNEEDPSWENFVVSGEDSVMKTWIRRGGSGYRLDVADELPDRTIEQMRTAVKAQDSEAFLLGEVWEDATTKQSYNAPRRYALGVGLDSVMNYPFRNMTVEFLKGHIDANRYVRFLTNQRLNYPKEMYYVLMNLLSSHDIARIRTALATDVNLSDMPREEQAHFSVTKEQDSLARERQKLAAVIQFSLPGIPSIYYGDEVGMDGLLDPFNRKPFAPRDVSLTEIYKTLASVRNEHPVLSVGEVLFYATDGNVLGILRWTADNKDAFGNFAENGAILTVINPTTEAHRIVIDLTQERECLTMAHRQIFEERKWKTAKSLVTDREAFLHAGLLDISIPALEAEIFELSWEY